METITLDHVVPQAFAADASRTDIWGKAVTLRRGERVRVEASSGSGKTTLCSFIMGMRTDYSGKILFDAIAAASLRPTAWSTLRQISLAWLPQEIGLFPHLTLRENITLKNSLTAYRTSAWIDEACASLGLTECLDRQASRMSVGQQQRGALVRALCQPMDFLLLDEPVSHLDAGWNKAVASLVDRELRASGAGLLLTSVGHHLDITINTHLTL